jgi:hypothetical protein
VALLVRSVVEAQTAQVALLEHQTEALVAQAAVEAVHLEVQAEHHLIHS